MARFDARELTWEWFEVLGKIGLFTALRVDRDTIPDDYYIYELRHADDDWGEPIEIGLGILVNFYGTFITKESIDLTPHDVLDNSFANIEEDDWSYIGGIFKFESDEES